MVSLLGTVPWLLTSALWFYLLLPTKDQRRLLPAPKLACPQFQRSVQRTRTWPSKSELLNLGPINSGSEATRLGSQGLYWSLCDAAAIKKKKKSVDFQTLVLPSCPSSPLDLLQREAKEWRERAIGGTRGRSFRPVLEEAFLTSPHFPHQGSVTGPIYMQGRPGNSTHELRSKGNGIINIFATGTILVGQQRSCWRRVLGTGQVHLSYLLLWDSHLAFPGAPATPWLAGSDPEA